MNIEKRLKTILFASMIFFILLFLFFLIIKYNIFLFSLGFVGLIINIFVFIILELYFRTQHNIDFSIQKNNSVFLQLFTLIEQEKLSNKNLRDFLLKENDILYSSIKKIEEKGDDLLLKIEDFNLKEISSMEEVVKSNFLLRNEIENNRIKIDSLNTFSENIIKGIGGLDKKGGDINDLINSVLFKVNHCNTGLSGFYWSYVKDKRFENLMLLIPDIFKHKSVLYIGARPDRTDFLQNFINAGYEISILEIYKPNVEYFKNNPRFIEVIEGDITNFNFNKKYDVVFWWHGPEHVEEEKIDYTLKKLESISNHLVVLGCPWGNVVQGDEYEDNPNEKHINFIKTGYLEKFGYNVIYFGLENNSGSSIIAVKR
jgi:hypothetical protein